MCQTVKSSLSLMDPHLFRSSFYNIRKMLIRKNREGNYNGKPASIMLREIIRAYRDVVDADAVRVFSAPKDNCRIVKCLNV